MYETRVTSDVPVVRCLYCKIITGHSLERGRTTVCDKCRMRLDRSELREVLAGQRPWARPLWFFANTQGAMPDEEAARAQAAWDRWQRWVHTYNNAHMGCTCSHEERANGHRRSLDCLPECFAPPREAALAALPLSDRTAYEDYITDLRAKYANDIEPAKTSCA
jgi:hypothetical protein